VKNPFDEGESVSVLIAGVRESASKKSLLSWVM